MRSKSIAWSSRFSLISFVQFSLQMVTTGGGLMINVETSHITMDVVSHSSGSSSKSVMSCCNVTPVNKWMVNGIYSLQSCMSSMK